jgi:plastocyanin
MTMKTIAMLGIIGVLLGCGGSGSTPTSPTPSVHGATVQATPSITFTPATTTIAAGATVTFDFGSVAHNVFFDAHSGTPPDISGNNVNTSVVRTFNTAGSYSYTCHIHPSMHGTVIVQ